MTPTHGTEVSTASAALHALDFGTNPLDDQVASDPLTGGIQSIIERRNVQMLFQPIVDLKSGQPVAYEALVRGPKGSAFEQPDQLFAAATAAGLVGELDLLCRTQALMQAARATFRNKFTLFVNGELGFAGTVDASLAPFLDSPLAAGRTVLELAERSIFVQPATILKTVAEARRRGWGIAIDDVGKTNDSIGLMGFTDPDVLKLDLALIQDRPTRSTGLTLNAVAHKVESTGATVIAEGIETEAHLARAQSLGAHLGQGWFFGRPEPLPAKAPNFGEWKPDPSNADSSVAVETGATFDLVQDSPRVRRATKDVLYSISRDLEDQASSQPTGALIFACFQRGMFITPETRARYVALGSHSALVVAFGQDLPENKIPGVRCISLDDRDPLADEWTIVIQSRHFSAALIARDCGDDGPDSQRRFDYCVTYDQGIIKAASQRLLGRIEY